MEIEEEEENLISSSEKTVPLEIVAPQTVALKKLELVRPSPIDRSSEETRRWTCAHNIKVDQVMENSKKEKQP